MAPEPGAPSDNTSLRTVLDGLAAEGFSDSFEIADDGTLTHTPSGTAGLAPADVEVVRFRRLEGASDPSDMVLVAAVRSAAGDGVVVVKYGPEADEGEAALLVAWQDELASAEPN